MDELGLWLNIIGLTCGMIGTALIYFYGVPRQTDTGGIVVLALEGDQGKDADEIERIKRFKILGNLGLMLIFAAFLLQLVSLAIAA